MASHSAASRPTLGSFFRSKSVAAIAAILLICLVGFLVESVRIHQLSQDAQSLLEELKQSKIGPIINAAEVGLAILTKNPKLALVKTLQLAEGLWLLVARGTEIHRELEIIASRLKTAYLFQSTFGWTSGLSATALVALRFRSLQKPTGR